MNKSKLKYICFCLFIILACIVINAFTSGIDLKMGLVNEDINKYIIEHQANTESLQVLKDEKTNLMTLQTQLSDAILAIKNIKKSTDTPYQIGNLGKTLNDNKLEILRISIAGRVVINKTKQSILYKIAELNKRLTLKQGVLDEKISQKEKNKDTDGGATSTKFTQGNFYKYNCTGSAFTRPCFSVMTEEEICKDNVKDCPSVSDNSNDSNDSDDGDMMSSIGNFLNSDKKKCPKLNKVLWGDSWACPAPQPCSKENTN